MRAYCGKKPGTVPTRWGCDVPAPKGQNEIAQGKAKRRPGYICVPGSVFERGTYPVFLNHRTHRTHGNKSSTVMSSFRVFRVFRGSLLFGNKSEYVVEAPQYRAAANTSMGWKNSNLRTEMTRLLRRAGVSGWP